MAHHPLTPYFFGRANAELEQIGHTFDRTIKTGEIMKDAIGRFHDITISDENEHGFWLEINEQRILLPASQRLTPLKAGTKTRVFLYKDSKNRLIATQKVPYGVVGDIVGLKVVSVGDHGAFLDWGVDKDLFVPFREQKKEMKLGETHLVKIAYDKKSDRLIGITRLDELISFYHPTFSENQKVNLIAYEKHALGWKCLIDLQAIGLLYEQEIHQPLHVGQQLKGFIKKIREDDKIDVSLQPSGYQQDFMTEEANRVIELLKNAPDHFLPLHDKSTPEEIQALIGMSKKTFKKAIGLLYKEQKINLVTEGIILTESE